VSKDIISGTIAGETKGETPVAQLNVEVEDSLFKRVKIACIEDGTNLKTWVGTALELALNFDEMAMARCRDLGWTPPSKPELEVIDVPQETPASKSKRVKKA